MAWAVCRVSWTDGVGGVPAPEVVTSPCVGAERGRWKCLRVWRWGRALFFGWVVASSETGRVERLVSELGKNVFIFWFFWHSVVHLVLFGVGCRVAYGSGVGTLLPVAVTLRFRSKFLREPGGEAREGNG